MLPKIDQDLLPQHQEPAQESKETPGAAEIQQVEPFFGLPQGRQLHPWSSNPRAERDSRSQLKLRGARASTAPLLTRNFQIRPKPNKNNPNISQKKPQQKRIQAEQIVLSQHPKSHSEGIHFSPWNSCSRRCIPAANPDIQHEGASGTSAPHLLSLPGLSPSAPLIEHLESFQDNLCPLGAFQMEKEEMSGHRKGRGLGSKKSRPWNLFPVVNHWMGQLFPVSFLWRCHIRGCA